MVNGAPVAPVAVPPEFVCSKIVATLYDGRPGVGRIPPSDEYFIRRHGEPDDDLQSAGLSEAELARSSYPRALSDPLTPAELRRLAIYTNYTGLMDTDPNGGYGLLFGPARNGRVLGWEYLAIARETLDGVPFMVMAQIPTNFDIAHPLIVTAPSSGSRGIYGAISLAEWAFSRGAAVAYTDKATGPALHDLSADAAYDLEGRRQPAGVGLDNLLFEVSASPELDLFRKRFPNRLAMKHAHSRCNVEAHWGNYVLASIAFALFCLNDCRKLKNGERFTRTNTKVIAAGVSNGGGAALRAAEADDPRRPLIDAIVVSEPQIQPEPCRDFVIGYRGDDFSHHSKSMLDVVTLMNIYAPCAALAPECAGKPDDDVHKPVDEVHLARVQRCRHLHASGLLKSTTLEGQAAESLKLIHSAGILREADFLLGMHESFGLWRQLSAIYANAYGRTSVNDHLCGISFAATDTRAPVSMNEALAAQLFGRGGGLAFDSLGAGRIDLINDNAVGGPIREDLSVSAASGVRDLNLDAALCFRALATGQSDGSERVAAGVSEVRASGNLQRKPAIILHGRSDGLLPPNHTSRAYYGLNKVVEGANSNLRYIEVVNGNHFDAFIRTFGASSLVPMHYYLEQALDVVWEYLFDDGNDGLPRSQVIQASAHNKPWTRDNYKEGLPDVAINPRPEQRIEFSEGRLVIP
jgi:hydroxybutyrate-dimer hydrolase